MDNEFNDFGDTVTLYDEDGKETVFSIIDGVEYNGKIYFALVEEAHVNDDECEFVILRNDKDENGEILVSIDDENEFNEVMKLLDEKLDDYELSEFEEEEEDGNEEDDESEDDDDSDDSDDDM